MSGAVEQDTLKTFTQNINRRKVFSPGDDVALPGAKDTELLFGNCSFSCTLAETSAIFLFSFPTD